MNGYDITLTILILLIFVVLFLTPMFSVGIQKIQQNYVIGVTLKQEEYVMEFKFIIYNID